MHRLAYSFGWDGSEVMPPGSSLIEIDLIEQPDGTLLRLTHTGLPNAELCAEPCGRLGAITSAAWPWLPAGATPGRTQGTATPAGSSIAHPQPHPSGANLAGGSSAGYRWDRISDSAHAVKRQRFRSGACRG